MLIISMPSTMWLAWKNCFQNILIVEYRHAEHILPCNVFTGQFSTGGVPYLLNMKRIIGE